MLDDFSLGVWKRPHNTFQSVEVTHRPERSPVRVSVCKLRGVEYDHLAQGIHQGEEVETSPVYFARYSTRVSAPPAAMSGFCFPLLYMTRGLARFAPK